MSLFGALVRTVVNTVVLPVKVVEDVVMSFPDVCNGQPIGHRTTEQVEVLKREADDDA